jgi:DNA-binding LacI/PurR family transcriptional regulator
LRLGKVGGNYDKQVTSYIAPDFGLQDNGYGYALAKTILEAKDPATAWIAMNDRLVIGAL